MLNYINKYLKIRVSVSFFLFYMFFASGCEDKLNIHIVSPEQGSMFSSDEDVLLWVTAFNGPIYVNGENTHKSFELKTYLEPCYGLCFIKVSKPGAELFDVRSYIQGDFRDTDEFHSNTFGAVLGEDVLNNDDISFASLTSDMMEGEELAPYVENPIVVKTDVAHIPVTITVNVTSVISPDIRVSLFFEGDKLKFTSLLRDVNIVYDSETSGIESSGTAFYDWMEVSGEVVPKLQNSDLINMKADSSEPEIHDDGGIPSEAFSLVSDALNEKVREAIANTTRNASKVVFDTLMEKLVPKVSLEFERPVKQDTVTESIKTAEGVINLTYKTKISAETPAVARAGQKVLKARDYPVAPQNDMSLVFGSDLVNQIAFAMWDAGNTSDIVYTKDELVELGMKKPEGYYAKLRKTEINLMLPPVLEWDETGPWLAMGGIEMKMSVEGGDKIIARSASKVPVKLQIEDDAMILKLDESRDVILFDTAFEKLNYFIERSEMDEMMNTAMPGVVNDLFGKFPIVKMTSVQLPKLNGEAGPHITTELNSVDTKGNSWVMHLSFKNVNETHPLSEK